MFSAKKKIKQCQSYYCHAPKTQCFESFVFLQLRDYIINQTTGDQEITVKYHYDNIVNTLFI